MSRDRVGWNSDTLAPLRACVEQEWDVSASEYYHLNLNLRPISLSDRVSGILGDTSRLKFDAQGNPILKAYDKDGSGILDKPIESYQVENVWDVTQPLHEEQ